MVLRYTQQTGTKRIRFPLVERIWQVDPSFCWLSINDTNFYSLRIVMFHPDEKTHVTNLTSLLGMHGDCLTKTSDEYLAVYVSHAILIYFP